MMAETVSIAGWDIAKLALTTGLVTALFTQMIGWFRDFRKERSEQVRSATYLALRVSVILEQFSLNCAHALDEIETHDSSGGTAGQKHRKLPTLEAFPTDLDWKSLAPRLASRVLTMQNELELAARQIRTVWDVTADEDAADEACGDAIGVSGFRAWDLAKNLRRDYRLPIFDPKETWWDAVAALEKVNISVATRRAGL
jgi:hypothetical protein